MTLMKTLWFAEVSKLIQKKKRKKNKKIKQSNTDLFGCIFYASIVLYHPPTLDVGNSFLCTFQSLQLIQWPVLLFLTLTLNSLVTDVRNSCTQRC